MQSASHDSTARYHRQMLLPQIGAEGQRRLGAARVLIVGCGALGSVAAELLARAGIGCLRIADRDLVELTNLQRQVLFDERDVAEQTPKAVAAVHRLRQINSQIALEPVVADVNAGNIQTLLTEPTPIDLIIDGTDNVSARYLINDAAVQRGIPWIYGGCVAMGGRIMGIWPRKTACLRCIFPDPPKPGELPTCDTAGVLGPASAIVGAMQAAMAIRFIVGHHSTGQGPVTDSPNLLTLDVWTGQWRSLASAAVPQPGCLCCGQRDFPFLSTEGVDFTTTLCGRNAVQVLPGGPRRVDLSAVAGQWQALGAVQATPWFIRCRLQQPSDVELTLFADGRLLVGGTSDFGRAKSIYARFLGD